MNCMKDLSLYAAEGGFLSKEEVAQAVQEAVGGYANTGSRVLLIIPDYTRYHSNAVGELESRHCHI